MQHELNRAPIPHPGTVPLKIVGNMSPHGLICHGLTQHHG